MLAHSSALSRRAVCQQQPRPFVAAHSRRMPVVRASAKLHPLVESFKEEQLKSTMPEIHIGDSIKVGLLVQEGKGKTRTQKLDGTVIAEAGSGSNKTITVRRIFQGVGIEMNFQIHSPVIASLEVTRRSRVRRAKLYYLRERTGKDARLKELIVKKTAAAKKQ
eukprot:jgi/Chrzof1/2122/Cz11g03120.t1